MINHTLFSFFNLLVNLDFENDVWAMNFYTTSDSFMKVITTTWTSIWKKTTKKIQPFFLPIFATDNFNSKKLKADDDNQGNSNN